MDEEGAAAPASGPEGVDGVSASPSGSAGAGATPASPGIATVTPADALLEVRGGRARSVAPRSGPPSAGATPAAPRHDLPWVASGPVAPRAGRWVGVTGLVLVGALLPVSPVAALIAGITVGTAALLAWRRIGAELVAFDQIAAVVQDGAGAGDLPSDLPGAAGRLARFLREDAAQRAADIARVQAELARAESLIAAAPAGVVLVDAEGRVELANAAARRLLTPRREPVGRRPIEAFFVAELQEVLDAVLHGAPQALRHAVHDDLDLHVEAVPVASGAMAIVRDESAARQAERARTDFVANVSHELRTPIAAILGYAETLIDEPGMSDDARHLARVVHRNGQRLSKLFDDLLALYRIETRRTRLPTEAVRLRPLLEEAVVSAAERGRARQIAVEVRCDPALAAPVHREALGTMIANLVSNACKYTLDGGRVEVAARVDGAGVHVDVSDTGIGIPRQHHERIFERFYRVDEGRAREVGGTGLGLAIVKHLALAMGATVTLRSEEGKGSTFTVHIPPAAPPAETRWDATL